jgi:hypothetical protein
MLLTDNVAERAWSMHHACCINGSKMGTDESPDKTSLLKQVVSPVSFSYISFVILFVVLVLLLGLQLLCAPLSPLQGIQTPLELTCARTLMEPSHGGIHPTSLPLKHA